MTGHILPDISHHDAACDSEKDRKWCHLDVKYNHIWLIWHEKRNFQMNKCFIIDIV